MIGIYITDGLGNQLFQYATARALSLRNKTDLYLDLIWFNLPEVSKNRQYQLDRFKISAPPPEKLINLS